MSWNEPGGPPNKGEPNPWGEPKQQNPWGSGPKSGPPQLEDLARRAQDHLRSLFSGGSGGGNVAGIGALAALAIFGWLASGVYIVSTNQIGLNMRFGAFTGKSSEGLNYNWPTPIGAVVKLNVTDLQSIDIGADPRADSRSESRDRPEENSLMLTGDDNIADVKFRVVWKIDAAKPEDYAFKVAHPPATVKAVAESAMREVVGRSQIQRLFTNERKVIEATVQELMQKVLESYQAGVKIIQVQLLPVKPPAAVSAAFNDVVAAQQDRDRLKNEADGYANKIVPEARGLAARILQEAEAYREQTVAEARGQASRYDQIFEAYKKAPDVTRERLYIETMERVLGAADKIVLDRAVSQNLLPLLPLNGQNLSAPPAQTSSPPPGSEGGARK